MPKLKSNKKEELVNSSFQILSIIYTYIVLIHLLNPLIIQEFDKQLLTPMFQDQK